MAKNRKRHFSERKAKAMKIRTLVIAAYAAVALATISPAFAHDVGDKVTPNFEQAIPNIPGKSLITVVVDYPPGAVSAPHTHARSAFIFAYVVAGEIQSKVNDRKTRTYTAGQGWSEPPGASHPISRNASKTKPAKLLAVFVVDTDDKALTTTIE
jgi:quercetin dioxygenase-like cupin family protein